MYVCLPVLMHLCCSMEKKGCVALNLSKIEDMQTRLQSNLEAIGMLNQQVRPRTRTLTQAGSCMRAQVYVHTGSWQSFYPTDTNTHPHTGPPAVELTQKRKLSCVQLQTHKRTYTEAHADIHFLFLR